MDAENKTEDTKAPTSRNFSVPASLAEAETRIQALNEIISSIQEQLTESHKTDLEGHRLSKEEYFQWKRKATYAQECKLKEIRFLKGWIYKQGNPSPVSKSRAYELLEKLYHQYVCSLDDFGPWEDWEEAEQSAVAEVEVFLFGKPVDHTTPTQIVDPSGTAVPPASESEDSEL